MALNKGVKRQAQSLRRTRAEERKAEHAKRTPAEQLETLETRGAGDCREATTLRMLISAERTP